MPPAPSAAWANYLGTVAADQGQSTSVQLPFTTDADSAGVIGLGGLAATNSTEFRGTFRLIAADAEAPGRWAMSSPLLLACDSDDPGAAQLIPAPGASLEDASTSRPVLPGLLLILFVVAVVFWPSLRKSLKCRRIQTPS
jgi:hypothetical protein